MYKLFATAATVLIVAVGTATAGTAPTAQGLGADGLRWQAMADHYGRLQGEKADGLRYEAMARFYSRPAPVVVKGRSAAPVPESRERGALFAYVVRSA